MTDQMPRYSACSPTVCLLISFLVMISGTLSAEIFRPLQIFLPGNLSGKLSRLSQELKVEPSAGWRIPDTIDAFRRDRSRDIVVFAPGNDSDLFAPLSFIDGGEFEKELIGRSHPEAWGISPSDIEMYNTRNLDREIRKRVFTNLDSGAGAPLFATHFSRKRGRQTIWFFNYIEPSICGNLPARTFGTAVPETPQRSLRRLNPEFKNDDLSISILHCVSPAMAAELAGCLKKMPGVHLLVQIPPNGRQPMFSTYAPEQDTNIFRMSVRPGHESLPLINILQRNAGFPRLTLRMLPLAKCSSLNAQDWHYRTFNRLKQPVFETLRVVTTTFRPSSSALHLSNQGQAHLLRITAASDIAVVIPPETAYINDNVISTGHIISCMPNDRVHRFRISGSELLQLTETLIKCRGIDALAFSGCEFDCLGGQVTGFRVAGHPVEPERQYMAVTTGRTLDDTIMREFIRRRPLETYSGQTIWNCWKNSLKTIKISDEDLFD